MPVQGTLSLPGDKSISHRALMLAGLTDGQNRIDNLSTGLDVESTRSCLLACGIHSERLGNRVKIQASRFHSPENPLDCGNSGTTVRLMLGLLAGQGVDAVFTGDTSLSHRPMNRVIQPLRSMGTIIEGENGRFPVRIRSHALSGISYASPVASAQVKSAILLAALGATGPTQVHEPIPTRDHTERMLSYLGARIKYTSGKITVSSLEEPLESFDMTIPGDPSSAAFFAAAAAVLPGSELVINNMLANPTRTGIFRLLETMGCELFWDSRDVVAGEDVGDLVIKSSELRAVSVDSVQVPGVIDELPILAILATQAEGTTVVRGAQELRVKESDRIKATCENLKRMGARVQEFEDGFSIAGPTRLNGADIQTYGDHRIAMAFAVAGVIAGEPVTLDNPHCVDISFPEFNQLLNKVLK